MRDRVELKQGKVYLVRTRSGKDVVLKRSDAAWSEVAAAAIGRRIGIDTIPARVVARDLLALPYVSAPALSRSDALFDSTPAGVRGTWYRALGRILAFDILIDNSDRLLKGANASNVLVSHDGALLSIDQRLGPAVSGEVDPTRVTRRRLLRARREGITGELFADLARELGARFRRDEARFGAGLLTGLAAGIRSIAALTVDEIDGAVHAAGAGGRVRTSGFAAILREFREAEA